MNKHAEWLTRFLFTHTRQTSPDGRPLYAYKCGPVEYAKLQEFTKYLIDFESHGGRMAPSMASIFSAIFCLYAAETFCREHHEGVWAWETIFTPLGVPTPSQQKLVHWVDQGLRWWHRPLIRGQQGDRRFLVTIACEGGLPLRLLQHGNASLTHFFRSVLDRYHAQGRGGPAAAEAIARQCSFCLPPTLRQEVVFHLGGELIAHVLDLQREVGNADDPIAALDNQVKDWRHRLPLKVQDETTKALLNGLIKKARDLAVSQAARPRWCGWLRGSGTDLRIEKSLHLPERLTGQQIRAWLGQNGDLKPRLRLMLRTPLGTEPVAWLTVVEGAEGNSVYRREWLRRGGLVLTEASLLQVHELVLHDGQIERPLPIPGDEPWDDLPWVFVTDTDSGDPKWLGEGSVRTRAEEAWVLANELLIPHSTAGGAFERFGKVPALGRAVYRVTGQVDFFTAEGDRYRISCQAEKDSDQTYSLVGPTLSEASSDRPLYLGIPRIQVTDSEGNGAFVSSRIQWRPTFAGTPWNDGDIGALGKVWLRAVDPQSGTEQFRRQIDVLPRSFSLQRTIGTGLTPGSYRMAPLGRGRLESSLGDLVVINSSEEEAIIECPPRPGQALPTVQLNLSWPGKHPLSIALPYPQRGATFQLAGKALGRDDLVALDRLGGLKLILQDPAGGSRFWLDGEFMALADPGGEPPPRLAFRERLPPLENGRLEVSVFPWHDRIASMLAASRELEAHLRLEISTSLGESVARILVARFDSLIEPKRASNQVFITSFSLPRLGSGWESRVRFEMIPLWEPGAQARPLMPVADPPIAWNLPEYLEPGPWWIIGRDGDWARFRPLLCNVADREGQSESAISVSALVKAIREPNPEQREADLRGLMLDLGHDPGHPDWPRLFDYIRLTREFPPSSLDVLRVLISHPLTLALALLKADDEVFDRVWAFSDQMPFSWSLIPVVDWRIAAGAYFLQMRMALGEIDSDGSMAFALFQRFRERTTARREYWGPLCDWLQERLFPDRPLPASALKFARTPGATAFMESQIQQAEGELQGRHDSDEAWPQSNEIDHWSGIDSDLGEHSYSHLEPVYRPVRRAPFVTAALSLKGLPPDESLIHELRLLRAFDAEWFDTVYAIALTLGLARLTPEIQR